jgi:hypothetical protein
MTGGRETRQADNATEQSVRRGMDGDADPPGLAPDRRIRRGQRTEDWSRSVMKSGRVSSPL